jgi:hypothetical protein
MALSLSSTKRVGLSARDDYNEHRPHSALAMKAPAAFARDWRRRNPPAIRPPAVSRYVRAPGSLRETPRQHPTLPCNPNPTTDSHNKWTDERGPASGASARGVAVLRTVAWPFRIVYEAGPTGYECLSF